MPRGKVAGSEGKKKVIDGESMECSIERVASCFQMVHQSSSEVYKRKKELIRLWKGNPSVCSSCIVGVVLLVLKQVPQLPNDVLKRHYSFLEAVAKSCSEERPTEQAQQVEKDQVAVDLIRSTVDFHNANDKAVRLSVVTTIEIMLKAIDQENTSDARQELYQRVAEALKFRIHDRCPHVRERAVAAVSPFQIGKRDCDVTQQLMALLCSDSAADVRRQILRSIVAKKEFLEGYFHGMIRCTNDAVVRVRIEAWDALGRFPWRYITAYASAKSVHLGLLLFRGLRDKNPSVSIACRSAMTSSWLNRDCKLACEEFLDPIISGYAFETLEPYEVISEVLYNYCKHSHPDLSYPLRFDDIHTSGLLMWKADCKAASDRIEEPEKEMLGPLPSLETFGHLLQDVVYCYTRPDAPMKVATFRSTDDADNMLRIILSVCDIYQEDGYLTHADNTTRHSLLKTMGYLLKVVPDDDPSLFVNICIKSLKALSTRMPEEAASTVTSALDSLFRTLKLPQRYSLGFEDVEAFGRKSRERQQELVRKKVLLSSGRASEKEYNELKAEIEKDEKFLLRIQHIVWSFLSNSQRGDEVPTFCTHVIQLGRHSDSESIQMIAMKSLGLHCLIRPEIVHTFMPIILSDASLHARDDDSLPVTAIGVVVDLVMEFGLNFFRIHNGKEDPSKGLREESVERPSQGEEEEGTETEKRLRHERLLAQADVHKVGSQHLQHVILTYLHPSSRSSSSIAVMGACKLLSANRLPKERVQVTLSLLLLHMIQFQQEIKYSPRSSYMASLLQKFFRSYATSHPRRQADLIAGGVVAAEVLLRHAVCDAMLRPFLTFILTSGDAFMLSLIRDIDPDVAQRVKDQEEALREDDGGRLSKNSNRSSSNLSRRSSTARSSMQSGRILKELSKHSLHERVAEHLLSFIGDESISIDSRLTCMDALEKRMYFYSKDPQPFLYFLADEASSKIQDNSLKQRLDLWVKEFTSRFQQQQSVDQASAYCTRREDLLNERRHIFQEVERYGSGEFSFAKDRKDGESQPLRHPVKIENHGFAEAIPVSKRPRVEDCDPFGVDSILGNTNKRFRK